jgi:hypothetical protein
MQNHQLNKRNSHSLKSKRKKKRKRYLQRVKVSLKRPKKVQIRRKWALILVKYQLFQMMGMILTRMRRLRT